MSLCETCRWQREVVSGKGSRFLFCKLSHTDPRFAKYPPQPVVRCSGYERRSEETSEANPPQDPGDESC